MFKLRITGNLMFETWIDIPGYEGLYQASTYGRIKNKRTDKIIKPAKVSTGYMIVSLFKEGKGKTKTVHKIIALTFLPKPKMGQTQINHKSEVKTENEVWNLEWCTPKYNINYGTAQKRRVDKKSKQVFQFDKNGKCVKQYKSLAEVKKYYNYCLSDICLCCNGKQKTAYGYIWKYA